MRKKVENFPVPMDVLEISKLFHENGRDLFIVGGSVRDFLQGKDPKDIDLVTNAQPDWSIKLLKSSGFRVSDEQGKKFGVIRVYTPSEPDGYEIAVYRKDISKGRDTEGDDDKVEIGSHITIEDDVLRRDLTANALFYDINTKEIVDLVGGIDDIKRGVIRAVGDPSERFDEDRLRILRTLRFAARSGGKLDRATSEAIKRDHRLGGIGPKDDVSPERIWDEFVKAFGQCQDFNKYLDLIDYYELWPEVFPGSTINSERVKSKKLEIILANLFLVDDRSKLEQILVLDYRLDSNLAKRVVFLIGSLNFEGPEVLSFFRSKNAKGVTDELLREWWDLMGCVDPVFKAFFKYQPSVLADDLMKVGFGGKMLGDKLSELEWEAFKKLL
jgi:tRNA nucleotidyltransferase/poly(A) polymerase